MVLRLKAKSNGTKRANKQMDLKNKSKLWKELNAINCAPKSKNENKQKAKSQIPYQAAGNDKPFSTT